MNLLRRLWRRIASVSRRAWAFTGIGIVVALLLLGGVVYAWDYTNSPAFCGTVCHTMPPEYTAYLISPHARVSCVECHIGRTFIGNAFTRKAGDLMHVVRYASNDYRFPLYAREMQPARESCEKCHWPEKFSDDTIRTRRRYEPNETSQAVLTVLSMKTGGGVRREGRGYGIHWHVENEVLFIATDSLNQNIPWVQVTDAMGKATIYADIEKPLTADQIAQAPKRRMDCIDCHNRISHTFRSPEQVVNQALATRQLDARIPFIAKKGAEVLGGNYKSVAEANSAIEGLDTFYRQQYPDFYQKDTTKSIQSAIKSLKQSYRELVFPTQELSWTTHPDNIGHTNSPGCFRCHDGKHFAGDNAKAIRLECNICHSLPQVYREGEPPPIISTAKGIEPENHAATTWLAQHRTVFDATCQQCHDTRNAGGKDNSSFCANSACHGTKWIYAGLNAPGLARIFPPPAAPQPKPGVLAKKIPHPIGGSPDCQICHGQKSIAKPAPTNHAGIPNEQCQVCHAPAIPPPRAETGQSGPPVTPHETAGRNECLGCHGSGDSQIRQVPKFHRDYQFGNGACLTCHQVKLGAPGAPMGVNITALPASHAGRTLCNVCHEAGSFGAKKSPANHQGRDDSTCLSCHKPK